MFTGGRRHALAAVLAVLLLVGTVAPVALTGGLDGSRAGIAAGTGEPSQLADPTPTANDTVRHENPDEAGEEGDIAGVQSWLAGRIGDRLEGNAINVSQGQYEAAEGLLGSDTRDFLDQYVDVAGDTDEETDDATAETLNETVREQRNVTETRRNYSELFEEYEAAIEAGDIERARRLARRLADLQRQLNRSVRELDDNYDAIENRTGVSLDRTQRALDQVAENVSEQTAAIRADLFAETRIRIESVSARASVLDPIEIQGRVVLGNDTVPPADHDGGAGVQAGDILLAGRDATTVSVDDTGRFNLTYRPVLLPAGPNRLQLRYRPPPTSGYLGSTTAVETRIDQRRASLEISDAPASAGFGETVAVEANLTVDGQPVDGLPLVATLGDSRLGSGRTGGSSTTIAGTVPAAVDDGDSTVRVAMALEGRAVAGANATEPIEIRETETTLRVAATASSPDTVRVRGRLETSDGAPVPGQQIRIAVDDSGGGGTPTTNATGAFETTIPVRDFVDLDEGDRRVPITATFEAPGTNLAPSSANTTVTVPSRQSGQPSPDDPDESAGLFGLGVPWWGWLAGLAVGVGTAVWLLGRRWDWQLPTGGETDRGPTASADDATGQQTGASPDAAETPAETTSLLEIASERLAAGSADDATQVGYEAVRRRLGEQLGVGGGTHWEFYRACEDANLPRPRVDALRRLTEAYEHAAFAPDSITVDGAEDALEAAREAIADASSPSQAD